MNEEGLISMFLAKRVDTDWKRVEYMQANIKYDDELTQSIVVHFFAHTSQDTDEVNYHADFQQDFLLWRANPHEYCRKQVHRICEYI